MRYLADSGRATPSIVRRSAESADGGRRKRWEVDRRGHGNSWRAWRRDRRDDGPRLRDLERRQLDRHVRPRDGQGARQTHAAEDADAATPSDPSWIVLDPGHRTQLVSFMELSDIRHPARGEGSGFRLQQKANSSLRAG